jgi:LysM repeat protein
MTLVSALASERHYVVKRNDTLSGIARQFGVSSQEIARRNQLKSSDHLLIGQRLVIPTGASASAPSGEYTVKPGDSLAAIAQQFGVSVTALAQRNGIKDPNKISIGQTLVVPNAGPAHRPALDPGVKREIDRPRIRHGHWQKIIIHHSGSDIATPQGMDRYHREEQRMENGLAYHFVIGNGTRTGDGEVFVGRRWTEQLDGGHLASAALNRKSIGICLIGDFNRSAPTARQMESLQLLVKHLMQRCNVSKANVQTHKQVNPRPTQCPGSKFPTRQFLADL